MNTLTLSIIIITTAPTPIKTPTKIVIFLQSKITENIIIKKIESTILARYCLTEKREQDDTLLYLEMNVAAYYHNYFGSSGVGGYGIEI